MLHEDTAFGSRRFRKDDDARVAQPPRLCPPVHECVWSTGALACIRLWLEPRRIYRSCWNPLAVRSIFTNSMEVKIWVNPSCILKSDVKTAQGPRSSSPNSLTGR